MRVSSGEEFACEDFLPEIARLAQTGL